MIQESVGTVRTEYLTLNEPLELESGEILPGVTIAFERYGKLNRERSNAILVCHALTGDAHAAGFHEGDTKPGWWESAIGPGKSIDTTKYFVICSNVLGGCKGTTGPSSIDPASGREYGLTFPFITISDMVHVQKRLLDKLEIPTLFAVIGGSMGGMQALQWAVSYPSFVKNAVIIASCAYSTPQQIAFNEVGRCAIRSDPDWKRGQYYGSKHPDRGLSLARMIGHITYLSDESMHQKFGRHLQEKDELSFEFTTDFQVESYLHHQGSTFTKRFDANSYLYITKAVDYFDLTVSGSLSQSFRNVQSKFLIIAVSSDWIYPAYLSQEIVSALTSNEKDVEYCELKSNYGHDAFLLEAGQLNYVLTRFLSPHIVSDIMTKKVPTVTESVTIEEAASLMISESVNHLPVLDRNGILIGIVTSWDISRSVAHKCSSLEEIMIRNVFTAAPDESVGEVVRRMQQNHISALPVIDESRRVIGLITAERLSRLVGRCR